MNNLPQRTNTEKEAYCHETVKLFVQTQLGYVALGERLKAIRDQHLYTVTHGSFEDFMLELNEFSMSMTSRIIGIHEKFVLEGGIDEKKLGEVGWTKLAMTLPYVHTKDEAIHWYEQASNLTKSDLRKTIAELKTGKKIEDCQHEEKYLNFHCPGCKDKWAAVDVSLITETLMFEAVGFSGMEATEEQIGKLFKFLVNNSEAIG